MKKILLLLVLGISMMSGFAQDQSATTLKNDGNDALRNKDYKTALAKFEAYLATGEEGVADDVATIYNAGYCGYKTKAYDKSIKYMQDAIDKNYEKAETAYQIIAYSYKKKKDDANYEATLKKGFDAFPQSKKIKGMLVKHYLGEGNDHYSKAAKILQAAAAQVNAGKYTTEDDAYKAELEKAQVEFKAALPFVEKALSLDPANETAKTLKENIQKNL